MGDKQEQILIAEDDERLAGLIFRKLSKEGYEVTTAGNGEQALEKIRQLLPDLVILDIRMPVMNGFEVKEALSLNDVTSAIPVIFLTGNDELYDKIRGLKLGADDYITKPFRNEELLARVEAILRRKRYYESLALRDGLTGLFNITYFQQQFNQFFNMAERYRTSFSLVIMDLNKFKEINDTYGHQAGDKVLKEVARTMESNLRKSDILSRYGGDEFALILPNTPCARAEEMARRLLRQVEEKTIVIDPDLVLNTSFSFGCVEYCRDWKSREEMFQCADKKMYDFKRSLKT